MQKQRFETAEQIAARKKNQKALKELRASGLRAAAQLFLCTVRIPATEAGWAIITKVFTAFRGIQWEWVENYFAFKNDEEGMNRLFAEAAPEHGLPAHAFDFAGRAAIATATSRRTIISRDGWLWVGCDATFETPSATALPLLRDEAVKHGVPVQVDTVEMWWLEENAVLALTRLAMARANASPLVKKAREVEAAQAELFRSLTAAEVLSEQGQRINEAWKAAAKKADEEFTRVETAELKLWKL